MMGEPMNCAREGKVGWVVLFLLGLSRFPTVQADPQLPSGFVVSLVAANVTGPTAMEFSPDGRLFVSQKSGLLRVIKDGVLLPQPFLSVDTDTQGEHGLI